MSEQRPLPLVPLPQSVTRAPGHFTLDAETRLWAQPGAEGEATVLRQALARPELPLAPAAHSAPPPAPGAGRIRLRFGDPGPAGEEAYRIEVAGQGITLTARHPAGLGRAVQTLRQLVPSTGAPHTGVEGGGRAVPCCTVVDAPRFAWRGLLLDVARHFLPREAVLRMLDLAALYRLSHVQLHLTDDQGWRLDVPARPRLRAVAAWRRGTLRGHATRPLGIDSRPHGGCYTAEDLDEIQRYARQRHVTLVPEIDLPGHVQAALAAYPELGMTGPHSVATGWGVSRHVLAPSEEALRFCRDVLDEVFARFDSTVIHLGGDECPTGEWRASDRARARAEQLGLDSVDGIQDWFHARLADYARQSGRRTAGWDEMAERGRAPQDAVVTAWRDWRAPLPAATALAAGHDVVLCPASVTYLDHYQSKSPEEPLAQGGLTSWEKIAGWEPLNGLEADATALEPERPRPTARGQVLGVQAQLWSEYLPTAEAAQYMALPRLGAVAEAGWTGAERRRAVPLAARLPRHLELLDALGYVYRPLHGPRPAGQPSQRGTPTRGETERAAAARAPEDHPEP